MRDPDDPRAGLAAPCAPLDYALMAAFGAANFALSFAGYWRPAARIFDEVYFARAAIEYLQNARIYENTHPPLSKLLVTASVMLFGGAVRGDTAYGWRFLDVLFGAIAVVLLYALAKRVTGSSAFASVTALLLTFDGMHFVQSRIATPESFVVCFALATTYVFARFWQASQSVELPPERTGPWTLCAAAAASLLGGYALALACTPVLGLDGPSQAVVALYFALGAYLLCRYAVVPRWFGGASPRSPATGWLVAFAVAGGLLAGTKWYGIMGLAAGVTILCAVVLQPRLWPGRPAVWGSPACVRLDVALATIVFAGATAYALVWVPDLVRQSPDPNEIHTVGDVVHRQASMYDYHSTLRATHPYSSKWWEWPLDAVPVAYFYEDRRSDQRDPHGCCIAEVTSLPNPLILWFGLFSVPVVAVLAWRERNKGYALLALTYAFQWLPWAASPRLAWEYHFYVDIPIVCLCDAIVLQRFWQWGERHRHRGNAAMAGIGVAGYVLAAGVAFVFFYPVLAAVPLPWDAWNARMWFPTWIIGPG